MQYFKNKCKLQTYQHLCYFRKSRTFNFDNISQLLKYHFVFFYEKLKLLTLTTFLSFNPIFVCLYENLKLWTFKILHSIYVFYENLKLWTLTKFKKFSMYQFGNYYVFLRKSKTCYFENNSQFFNLEFLFAKVFAQFLQNGTQKFASVA